MKKKSAQHHAITQKQQFIIMFNHYIFTFLEYTDVSMFFKMLCSFTNNLFSHDMLHVIQVDMLAPIYQYFINKHTPE